MCLKIGSKASPESKVKNPLFLESSGLVGLSSRLRPNVRVLKSSNGCVGMVDNQ